MPALLWKTLVRRCESSAALSEQTTFLVHDGRLSCFDPGGRTVWSAQIGASQATPTLEGRRVYVGTDAGLLLALDAKTGKTIWRFSAPGGFKSEIALGATALFAESTDGTVHAIEAASGTGLWKFARPDGSLGYAAPTLAGDAALFVAGETTLYRLDPAGGTLIWKSVLGGRAASTPARTDGKLILGGDGTGVTALSEDDGNRLWRFPASGKTTDWYGAPLSVGKVVYVGTVRGLVYALDSLTGKRLWATSLPGEALARPTLDETRGLLWVTLTGAPASQNSLVALDLKTGKVRTGFKLGEVSASPVITKDRLYIGTLGGFFYAYSLK
jgi:eukaryotic-like serine/threonine-protein kinase